MAGAGRVAREEEDHRRLRGAETLDGDRQYGDEEHDRQRREAATSGTATPKACSTMSLEHDQRRDVRQAHQQRARVPAQPGASSTSKSGRVEASAGG